MMQYKQCCLTEFETIRTYILFLFLGGVSGVYWRSGGRALKSPASGESMDCLNLRQKWILTLALTIRSMTVICSSCCLQIGQLFLSKNIQSESVALRTL